MNSKSLRSVVVGSVVGIGCGVVLAKKYFNSIDKDGEIKKNSKKLAEDTVEWGKSVGNAAKRVYATVSNKVSDVSEEIKEKFNEKKADILNEETEEKLNETQESSSEYKVNDSEVDEKDFYNDKEELETLLKCEEDDIDD